MPLLTNNKSPSENTTTTAFNISSVTTEQRDAITNPELGSLVFNNETENLELYKTYQTALTWIQISSPSLQYTYENGARINLDASQVEIKNYTGNPDISQPVLTVIDSNDNITTEIIADGTVSLSTLNMTQTSITPENPSTDSNKLYFKSDDNLYKLDSAGNEQVLSVFTNKVLPDMRLNGYTQEGLTNYINSITQSNSETYVRTYTHGITVGGRDAYGGGAIYDPVQNRVYFIPYKQAIQPLWHYINCDTGSVVAYTNGGSAVLTAYGGGVFSPTQKRIYLVPYGQSDEVNWQYIDCVTGTVVDYVHGATVVNNGYWGGVYSPLQNRIYLIPYHAFSSPQWHYIDCSDGLVVAYTHGATVAGTYCSATYSPTENRIYLTPGLNQSTQPQWHYIDCSDGHVVGYTHGLTITVVYCGSEYSPTENKIYFTPERGANNSPEWHYIDCDTGILTAYTHGATVVDFAYTGGVYHPLQNRIYFIPAAQGPQPQWHYIDCSDGSVVPYTHGATVSDHGYYGGIYSPLQNRIYFSPAYDSTQPAWHFISTLNAPIANPGLMSGPLFNTF